MKDFWTYSAAGVNRQKGDGLVAAMEEMVRSTHEGHNIPGPWGGFSGVYGLAQDRYLLASCDGVGSKVLIAQALHRHDTIGIDLIAMVVNDLLAQGGRPLFFLDYMALGKLEEQQGMELISGMVHGCCLAGCALLGGETAEMPDLYAPESYDLAGFAVGEAQKEDLLPKEVKAGDLLLGLPSTGLHSNGYTLVRKVLLEKGQLALDQTPPSLHRSLGDELLEPTRIYRQEVDLLREKYSLKGLAHITGGGLAGNLPRILPQHLEYSLDLQGVYVPPIFRLIQEEGPVREDEMYHTFNMGIGMVAILSASKAREAVIELNQSFYKNMPGKATIIGTLQEGCGL